MKAFCLLVIFVSILTGCDGNNSSGLVLPDSTEIYIKRVPLVKGRLNEDIVRVISTITDKDEYSDLLSVDLILEEGSNTGFIESVELICKQPGEKVPVVSVFGISSDFSNSKISIQGKTLFGPGTNVISANFVVKENGLLHQSIKLKTVQLTFDQNRTIVIDADSEFVFRPATMVRSAGQDNVDTYRIPGLVTTNEGTLIAVYDNRYKSSKDLQEDVDIGMSRSIDCGQTWEPMKIIMDMGEWGGLPESLNGTGDPSVLYDPITSTIWVAALWMSGLTENDMLWWASKPGSEPNETGQILLVKSTDDGLSWSEPINISNQVKDHAWQLLLQGPGRGIAMKDGTLVFPAQFKKDIGEKAIDGGQYTSHSSIIYSTDHGLNWKIGTGAQSNTTEAQVVELDNGELMLNMRDDRNRKVKDEKNGRAVAVTRDMGSTWTAHSSTNSLLPEPNCMASLISADIDNESYSGSVLFFSNPNSRYKRTNMTLKASIDNGVSWPEEYHVELNELECYGYSCMSMVNDQMVGILYEGVKDLYFQVIRTEEILGYMF